MSQPRSGGRIYGVVDTTFSRVNMGAIAVRRLHELGVAPNKILRTTVPGFKDLAVEAMILIDQGADIVIACGMPGGEEIDKICAHEASQGIMQARLMTKRHILEVFVHMDEVDNDGDLAAVCENRTAEHAENAWMLLEAPDKLVRQAGTGQRQGFADVGPVTISGGNGAPSGGH